MLDLVACQQAYQAQYARLHQADISAFRPWFLDGVALGWWNEASHAAIAPHLIIETQTDGYHWHAPKRFAERNQLLRQCAQDFLARGLIHHWRDEDLPLWASVGQVLLGQIERSAFHVFGALAYGVHLNAYTIRDGKPHLWLARRSAHKATAPNQLDQLCAGALSVSYGVLETVYKEAWEEAGIPQALLAGKLSPVREIRYRFQPSIGLRDDVMLCFDVELPSDFVPQNHDGEVADFYCVPLAEALHEASGEGFKRNSAVATLDFLCRYAKSALECERC